MNQEKIGKYIKEKRKEKKLTQLELASRLGVSEKTVSNWENGRNMPDLSLFNPLCEKLDISINELMKGEKIDSDDYQKVLEENMVNTIDYSNKNIDKKIKKVTILFISLFVLILGFMLFYNGKQMVIEDNYPVYQEVYIDNRIIDPTLKKYILDNMLIEENDNSKNFVSYEIFSIEQIKENDYYVYSWILESTYESDGEVLHEQSASSYPCRFELKKENNNYKVTNFDVPRDGNLYNEDLKIYFPKYVRDKMEKLHDGKDNIFNKLNNENIRQAKEKFNLS